VRIAILTWGTRGDVQPLLALAKEFVNCGAEVSFGGPPPFAECVRAHDIEFTPVGTPMNSQSYQDLMDAVETESNPRKQNRLLLQKVLLPDLERLYTDSLAVVAGADVVISHWLQIGGMLAAEVSELPCATVTLHPAGIELSQSRRSSEAAGGGLGDWLWGDQIQRFRAQLGLRSVESLADSLYSRSLNLVAVSPSVLPESVSWASHHRTVGFFYLKETANWQPDEKLLRFLEVNEKPIVISFSSIADSRPNETSTLLIKALVRIGRPAIIQSGWGNLGCTVLPDGIIRVGDVPHSWLFRQAACVVHHGGAGTTAEVLRAGIPSVVVWHMFDQPYWGNRLAAQGLGPRPIARATLNPDLLAERVIAALSDPSYLETCQRMAMVIAQEKGTIKATQAVHTWFARSAELQRGRRRG